MGSIDTHMYTEVMQVRNSKGGHKGKSLEWLFLKGNGAVRQVLGILED